MQFRKMLRMKWTTLLLVPFAALIFSGQSLAMVQEESEAAVEAEAAEQASDESGEASTEADSEGIAMEGGDGTLTKVKAEYDKADLAWMLISIALVLMMTAPGLALFYGGLVRKKNILSVMMQCVFLMGIMSIAWLVIGYSLAFGGETPYYGGFQHIMLNGVSPAIGVGTAESVASAQIIVAFQGMFFIITPALICGAYAERMKFSAMVAFSLLWGLLIYCPIAHWVWADNGWLCHWNKDAAFPAIDFAGGLVVHISSGVAALMCAIVIGKRRGFPSEPMPPHNLTYTVIGTGLLWVGWFGFNGGSELFIDGIAVNAVLTTHMAAAAGVLGWSLAEIIKHGKASILGACSGAVAGLVCITPASGSVTPVSGMIMGFIAGLFCYFCCTSMKNKFGYDDSLDAFGIHGMGGVLGAILTGVFATSLVTGATVENKDGSEVLQMVGGLQGNWSQMTPQLVSVGAAFAFSAIGSLILLKVLDAIIGLRVTEDEEVRGLDITQHGEEGYIFQ